MKNSRNKKILDAFQKKSEEKQLQINSFQRKDLMENIFLNCFSKII